MHYYVIPDIHGRNDLLQMALTKIYQDNPEGGKIIFLGDYIDRGPENVKVLDTVMNPPENWEFVCLMGNHEDMFVAGYNRFTNYYDMSAVKEIVATGKLPKYVDWMSKLKRVHVEDQNYFVHAFYDVTKSLEDQNPNMNVWQRVPDEWSHGSPDHYIVHGHTPRGYGPVKAMGRINMDAGAVFYDRLVVAKFEKEKMGPQEFFEFKC